MTNVNLSQALFVAANSKRTDVRDDNNAEEYDAITIARGKQIDLFFEATLDVEPGNFEVAEEDVDSYLMDYYRFCENDALQIFMPPSV